MGDIIKETIEKLKSEKMKPISKWRFFLKKFSMWGLFFAVAVFSSIASAAILFLIFQFDWDVPGRSGGVLFFGFRFLPYFWITLTGLLMFAAYEVVRHTKSGYRYDWRKVALTVLGLVFGIGVLAHFTDLGRRADFVARKNVPGYRNMVRDMKDQWSKPQNGFLAGEIISSGENEINLEDFEGDEWKVLIDEHTLVRPRAEITKDKGIKIIGEKISENEFKASEIRPWMGNAMQKEFDREDFHGRHHLREGNEKSEDQESLDEDKEDNNDEEKEED